MSQDPFYITTAISYPNGVPHIGHAYEAIATDTIARFKRLDGFDVYFLTGTDEHGLKMEQTAREQGVTAQELADKNSQAFVDMAALLNISNDDFVRTSQERHHKTVHAIWEKMTESGDIYLDQYQGWYSIRDEAYYEEGETRIGEDGVRVGPQGTPVEWTEEETYFFKLTKYQEQLISHFKDNDDFVMPKTRRNEVLNFIENGLRDLSISRTTFDWGIKVPNDEKHVIYVWVDALVNYLTALNYPDEEGDLYRKFWPVNCHVIGKDILRFHAVYWPAFLMSAGLPLPEKIFAHGFLFNRGEKMSKSLGNVVSPTDMASTYGVDQIRYFLLREVPFGQDGNYSHEAIVARINADLANDLGNLSQRSMSMIFKNCNGVMPESGALEKVDQEILLGVDGLLDQVRPLMDQLALHKALEVIWQQVANANKYFASQEPWALKTANPKRMETVLYVTAEVLRQFAILSQAFMPTSAAALMDLLHIDQAQRDFAALGEAGRLKSGFALLKPTPIFPRFVEEEA